MPVITEKIASPPIAPIAYPPIVSILEVNSLLFFNVVPANAILARDGTPLRGRDGSYILGRT